MISSDSSSQSGRSNSSKNRTRSRAPTSLQAICAHRSPIVSSGTRTFARTIRTSVSFGSPRRMRCMIGIRMPSS